jgi:hypothetical protein
LRKVFNIQRQVLAWLYESNSTDSIGKMFGFGAETIRKRLKQYNIERSKVVNKIPSKKTLLELQSSKSLVQIGEHFNVKQTLVHKWLDHHNIEANHKLRQPRANGHSAKIADSLRGRTYPEKRQGLNKKCATCNVEFYVSPPRLRQSERHYCSIKCKGISIRLDDYSKVCPQCDEHFCRREGETAGNYQKRVYCSRDCANIAHPPPIFKGADSPHYKGIYARKKQPRGGQNKWRRQVLSRDEATCQHCKRSDVPVVAHHVLSWEDFPEQREDPDNGLTLCNPCHYKEHGWNLSDEGIKVLVNDKGIETRRWVGACLWCDAFLVKQASDMRRQDGTYRTYGFCNHSCRSQAFGLAHSGMPKSELKGFCFTAVYEAWAKEKKASQNG